MKLEYSILDNNIIRVKLGIKPDGANEASNALPKESIYRKEIECTTDVSFEGLPEKFKMSEVPEVILANALGHIKVDIQSTLRALGGEGTYEQKYERLKNAVKDKQTFTATLNKVRTGVKKSVSVLDTLLRSYGVEKLAKHLLLIAKDMQEGMEPKECLLKWATVLEKEKMK